MRIVSPTQERSSSASVLLFKDDEVGRSWNLQAEEGGPFPGRMELEGFGGRLDGFGVEGSLGWSDYQSELRSIGDEGGIAPERIAAKGGRVFPSLGGSGDGHDAAPPAVAGMKKVPRLIPYDSASLAWMPDRLPAFVMPEGTEKVSASWRFTVNLRADGSVRESISLGGGDDAGQAAMEDWLLGVRFKEGAGDRWLGLRVEFVNIPGDGTGAE
ncbi:hypothetical protein HZ994_00560 [Akkermansiaceae bacterium]|nr:hypothetical protein HZ994_00560 [Akkermansiaceae bacterium]